jgi:hypothetical protein
MSPDSICIPVHTSLHEEDPAMQGIVCRVSVVWIGLELSTKVEGADCLAMASSAGSFETSCTISLSYETSKLMRVVDMTERGCHLLTVDHHVHLVWSLQCHREIHWGWQGCPPSRTQTSQDLTTLPRFLLQLRLLGEQGRNIDPDILHCDPKKRFFGIYFSSLSWRCYYALNASCIL